MVHIVKKSIRGEVYLYLQESLYNGGKRTTRHVAYLGRADQYSKKELDGIISKYNKSMPETYRSKTPKGRIVFKHRPKKQEVGQDEDR